MLTDDELEDFLAAKDEAKAIAQARRRALQNASQRRRAVEAPEKTRANDAKRDARVVNISSQALSFQIEPVPAHHRHQRRR